MPSVFICYRRADSSGYTGRIHDDLAAALGPERVFMDIEAIEPGVDFVDAVRAAIGEGKVLLVVIGKKWLIDDQGRRRLEQPNDHVRVEIETALQRRMPVIPVLVDGASMPDESELPESIKGLARRNACELSNQRWKFDMERLVSTVCKFADLPQPGGPTPVVRTTTSAGALQRGAGTGQLRPYLIGGVAGVSLLVALGIWAGSGDENGEGAYYDDPAQLEGTGGGGTPIAASGWSPNYGTHQLQAGFTPDPFTLSVTAGGPNQASTAGAGCVGYISEAPDVVVQWSGHGDVLRIFFEGEGDATLVIQDPLGSLHCNDDSLGTLHPMVDFVDPNPGEYSVWVGTQEANHNLPGLIYVTEERQNQPQS